MFSVVILSAFTITTVFGDGHIVNCTREEDCECGEDVSECTLNCIGEDQCKDIEISCNEVDLCYINCIGNNACAGNTEIDGTDASTVSLFCDGKDACKGNVELYCGEGDCSISCVNATSCESIDIDAEDASSFTCSGYCDVSDDIPDSFTPSTTEGFMSPTANSTEDASAESTETLNTTETTSTTSTSTTESEIDTTDLETTDMESTEWTTTTSTTQQAEFIADDSSETTTTESVTLDLSTTDIEDLISSTEEALTSTTYTPTEVNGTESMEESSNSTTTTSTTTSTANVQVMGEIGAQSNGEEAFAQNEEHYHDVGGHETHILMFLLIVAGALLLICFCVFAFYCRLRLSAPKTHERVQSGIALDDLDMEMDEEEDEVQIMETDMGIDIETDRGNDYEYGMVYTNFGIVEPGTFEAERTDEMCMLPH